MQDLARAPGSSLLNRGSDMHILASTPRLSMDIISFAHLSESTFRYHLAILLNMESLKGWTIPYCVSTTRIINGFYAGNTELEQA